jgi:NADPH:quinone reductase-like Zn-dependent oxidoreductase
MRAVRYHEYGEADVLRVEEIDRPSPKSDELLVEIRAASVNPVDVMFRTGQYGETSLPSIPGGDGAGVVTSVGRDVESFAEGDRVIISGMDRAEGGTFAEYAAVPSKKLARLPEHVSFTEGGAIGNVGATAWTALTELATINPGDRVLIHGGSGGVGHAAVQIAASAGAEVLATAGSADGRTRIEQLGAAETFDYECDSLAEDIFAATDGEGVETIVDHRLEEYLALDLQVISNGGRIISTMGHIPETVGVPFYDKEVTLQALKMDNRPVRTPILQRVIRLVEDGVLAAEVADSYEFDEVDQAHQDVIAGGYVGKLVVTP